MAITVNLGDAVEKACKVVEIAPTILTGIRQFHRAYAKCSELEALLRGIKSRENDMVAIMKAEVANDLCNKPKQAVQLNLDRLKSFTFKAKKVINKFRNASRVWRYWMIIRGDLDVCLRVGKQLLKICDQHQNVGLMFREIFRRGVKLPVEKLIGKTAEGLRKDVSRVIKEGSGNHIIGIHGNCGAGKTNFLKWIHNDVFDHKPNLVLFWAGAPEEKTDTKSIQDCIAEAMKFDFKDRDVVRRAGVLSKRLKDLGPGHIVLFIDNLKEPFQVNDVGLPVGYDEAEDFRCTLVFTAKSENICNRMRCSATEKFKMDLLQESEAHELFLFEAGCWNHGPESFDKFKPIAHKVAQQCDRMPLVITLIARSMTGKVDLCEWNNRLDELKGTVENMHDDEAKILEQLKFSFNCLTHDTLKDCFLYSATILTEGHRVSSEQLVSDWMSVGLTGKRSRNNSTGEASNNQGHAIINQLQRLYLLEVSEVNGTKSVSMNKWIRKMAESVLNSRSHVGKGQANRNSARDNTRSHPTREPEKSSH